MREDCVQLLTIVSLRSLLEGGDGRIIELCQDINYNQKQLFHALKPFLFPSTPCIAEYS